MTSFKSIIKNSLLTITVLGVLNACNKDVEQFPDNTTVRDTSGVALGSTILADANYSLYAEVIKKSGYIDTLNNKQLDLTMFVPTNAAVKAAVSMLTRGQIPVTAPDSNFIGFIQSAAFTPATANGLVKYNTVPQAVDLSSLTNTTLNNQYPTMINPAPQLSALARLTSFLTKAPGLGYVNNVPVAGQKVAAGNGVFYPTGALVMPPTRVLMQRIAEAGDLTYFKAAVAKADSGLSASQLASPTQSLTGLLSSFGPNITVFAPTDSAFQATLYSLVYPTVFAGIKAQAMAQGANDATATAIATERAPAQTKTIVETPAVFQNPLLASKLSAATVKGLLAYHILPTTNFTNNFPTTETSFRTLISATSPTLDPQLKITAAFTGPLVSTLSVKGAVNPTAAKVSLNPTPEPGGSSDQFYVNGTLNKIDQILLPQSF